MSSEGLSSKNPILLFFLQLTKPLAVDKITKHMDDVDKVVVEVVVDVVGHADVVVDLLGVVIEDILVGSVGLIGVAVVVGMVTMVVESLLESILGESSSCT